VGVCLFFVPMVFEIDSSLKDVIIAVGGLLAGQITILISEIPRAKEKSSEKRELARSALLVGVSIGWLSLMADSPEGKNRPDFVGKASARLAKLGVSEKPFDKLLESQISRSESLQEANALCEFYQATIEETHPLLLPLYRAGLTGMAAGNLLFCLTTCAKGSAEEVELNQQKHKATQNLKQAISGISKSREYRRPGEDLLNPILTLLETRNASYKELIRYLESI
jgi:hypothetical protein